MTSPEQKIKSFSEINRGTNFKESETIVLCYGHFNVIHPGHIRYLEYANTLGSNLYVAIDGDQVFKDLGQKKYNFNAKERANAVALLPIVDFVTVLDKGNLEELIEQLAPEILVLGNEFQTQRRHQMKNALNILKKNGGRAVFHAGEVQYATTDLLDKAWEDPRLERVEQFQNSCKKQGLNHSELIEAIDRLKNGSLLVLGDTIIDQYVACEALGVSAEAPVLVVKELKSKEFIGGASLVASHIKTLGAESHYISVVGKDEKAQNVRKKLESSKISYSLVEDETRPTTYKIRYMVETQKLFRVSRLQEHRLSEEIENSVIQKIEQTAPNVHGIVVSDFVYGLITEKILETLQKVSRKYKLKICADLQCSSQVGNISKYKNTFLITPTEKEARVAIDARDEGIEWVANKLIEKTNTANLILKLGADGFIVFNKEPNGFINRQHFPALTINPLDVTGAGDSMLAVIATSLCAGNSMMVSAALGACMASLTVQTLGNLPIDRASLKNQLKNLKF